MAHPSVTLSSLSAALEVYDHIIRPFSQEVQRRSRETGRLYELYRLGWEGVSAKQSRNGEYPPELLSAMADTYEEETKWVTEIGSIMDDREKAVRMVEHLTA